ncbi:uncharacterized protein TNCV_4267201 [Trichonephila clavipes]|nr:uncharacterized protein TNCV_4267201 [Trichonephila clavipes]
MGGLWEAGIKSLKYHLKRALGRSQLTYDEFETVIIQGWKEFLNSRPLTPISKILITLSRWQKTTKIIPSSLKKWSTDYLEYSPTERKVDDREGQCNVWYNEYGNAIRCISTSVKEMRKAIWPVVSHFLRFDDEPMHWFCLTNPIHGVKYNAAINNNLQNSKHKPSVAKAVRDVIKPVFADLSHPALLKKCLGDKTKNPNESLNSLISKFCPKTIGSSLQIAEIAANLATSVFNDGNKIFITILEKFGLKN